MPVHVEMLKRVTRAPVDIYVQPDRRSIPMLYCRAGLPMENHQLLGLSEAGIKDVYVRNGDFQDFGLCLMESVQAQLASDEVSAADQYAALQLAVAVEVERTSLLIDCSKYVATSEKVARDLTTLIASNNVMPRDLFRIARHDYNTFTHVTNVACFTVVLAERMGIRSRQELDRMAVGAILHDIGKRFIPPETLNKRGPLDRHERDIIEAHPQRGYEELYGRSNVDREQLMMVYQHHERLDGTGYPVRIFADEIHPWAQLLAVVDVFEAMTGRRPYRRPASAADVFAYLDRKSGAHFNTEMVACWNSAMREK